MPEKTIPLPIEETYQKLRNLLLTKGCKIVNEQPPNFAWIKQGSLSGILPKSAKKNIRFELSSSESKTKITAKSDIDSVWTNLTLYGSILATVLAGVLLWAAADMEAYAMTAKSGVWTWLAGAYGYPDVDRVLFTVAVNRDAAFFLILAVVFEVVIAAYVYPRKDAFAKDALNEL